MEILTQSQLDPSIIDWPVHMERALELAARVISATPNPRVGCVIVKNREIVGEGWHTAAGAPHAEVNALGAAGEQAGGATVFVTLEPCAHHGRTGPCSEALITAGVARVVIAGLDPNPDVAGKGIKDMQAAGISVFQLKDFADTARSLNRGYYKRRESGLPFVTVKLAMSLDGRTALASGESQWITGPAARRDVQRLRAGSSAIVTGVNTILQDDPLLTVRAEELGFDARDLESNSQTLAQPRLRVIIDSQLKTPGTARLFSAPGDVVIFTTVNQGGGNDSVAGAHVVTVDGGDGEGARVDLQSVLESLAADYQCNDMLVEAGPTLGGAFLEAGLVDELVVYVAPKLLGADGRPLLEITGPESLEQATGFNVRELKLIGEDIRLILTPKDP